MLRTKQKESQLFHFFLLLENAGLRLDSKSVHLVILVGHQCHFLREAFSDPPIKNVALFFIFIVSFCSSVSL